MQVHEITTKINEGFMDAIKGIAGVAAQGLNQNLGTNIGGVQAGATVGPGQRQQSALQINQGLAAKQANGLADRYIQSVTSLMGQAGVKQPSQLSAVTQTGIRKEVDQIIFKQLLPNAYIQDLNQLNAKVDKTAKPQMNNAITKMNSARRGLYDLNVVLNPSENLRLWTDLASAAAEAMNLISFSGQGKTVGGVKPGGDITIDYKTNQFLYRGQAYNQNDPIQRAAMSKFIQGLPK